jgi:hypothetical protein
MFFGVAPSAVKESVAKSLSYWSTGEGNDTMVTLWNPADEAQDFVFTRFFTGGQYNLPLHLEAKVTRTFNISEIISDQIPDNQGRTVPVDIHEGSAMLSGPRGESEHILISFEAGTYNVQKATCGKWCGTCMGATESFITSDPWAVTVSGAVQETYTAQYNTGKQFNITSASTWSSVSTTIATVSTGKITGHVAGGTRIASNDDDVPDYTSGCYTYEVDCPLDEGVDSSSPGNVQCNMPRSETTAFSQWGDNDPNAGYSPSYAEFIQTLTPSADYSGVTVSEANASPATDSCWFNGAIQNYGPPVVYATKSTGVSGGSWSVAPSGAWGPDGVGLGYTLFGSYQTSLPQRNLTSCSITLFQQLTAACSTGASSVYDSPVIQQITITGGGISVTREGVNAARLLTAQ